MEKGIKRKLTAILSADVAGYSRLMGDDEVATVSKLNDYRKDTGIGKRKKRTGKPYVQVINRMVQGINSSNPRGIK
jgi:hypothetical protein